MNDAFLMRRLQRLGDLLGVSERLFERKRAGGDLHVQAFTFDELHGEDVPPGDLLEGVDAGDARVIQRGERLRFSFEARYAILVLEEFLRQNFQRDIPCEARVRRPVHFSHPSGAERSEDLVGSEPGTRR